MDAIPCKPSYSASFSPLIFPLHYLFLILYISVIKYVFFQERRRRPHLRITLDPPGLNPSRYMTLFEKQRMFSPEERLDLGIRKRYPVILEYLNYVEVILHLSVLELKIRTRICRGGWHIFSHFLILTTLQKLQRTPVEYIVQKIPDMHPAPSSLTWDENTETHLLVQDYILDPKLWPWKEFACKYW